MIILSWLAGYVSDPYLLVFWIAVVSTWAITSFTWESGETKVRITLPKVKWTAERRWMAIRDERSR